MKSTQKEPISDKIEPPKFEDFVLTIKSNCPNTGSCCGDCLKHKKAETE
ncbi:MAG: hypothetical protein AAF688_01390 [Bacteroidota bacterium]